MSAFFAVVSAVIGELQYYGCYDDSLLYSGHWGLAEINLDRPLLLIIPQIENDGKKHSKSRGTKHFSAFFYYNKYQTIHRLTIKTEDGLKEYCGLLGFSF